MKDWLTHEDRDKLCRTEPWTRLQAVGVMAGLVVILLAAIQIVLEW